MKTKPIIGLLLVFVLSILPTVHSQTDYFGISLECFQGCNEGTSYIDQSIILKLILTNNFEYWVHIGDKEKWDKSASLRIIAENTNLKDGKVAELYQFIIGNPIYIPPKSNIEIYIPFDVYNNLEGDKRIGDWKIKSEIGIENVIYYEDPFNGKTVDIKPEFQIPRQITGNILKFEAKKKELKIEQDTSIVKYTLNSIKEFLSNWIGYIIAGLIITIVGGYALYKLTKNRR